uniref:DNA polymerase epsilon subunit 3 n=1 Tax=Ornithodoros turicata TaxID=34597 RepID=A0A2R5LHM6_9ACAR
MAERPEDLNLPMSVVTRIVRDALPDGVNVSKEARAALAKAASVFVLYATSCANNIAVRGKRKTVTGSDIVSAMGEMEFESFVDSLSGSLEQFRQGKSKKESTKHKREKSKDKTGTASDDGDNEVNEDNELDQDEDDDMQEEVEEEDD